MWPNYLWIQATRETRFLSSLKSYYRKSYMVNNVLDVLFLYIYNATMWFERRKELASAFEYLFVYKYSFSNLYNKWKIYVISLKLIFVLITYFNFTVAKFNFVCAKIEFHLCKIEVHMQRVDLEIVYIYIVCIYTYI